MSMKTDIYYGYGIITLLYLEKGEKYEKKDLF